MTAVLLDRPQIDDITRQAHEIRPARTILMWVGALLFAIGWVIHKTFMGAWFVGAWAFVAVREGWRAAGTAKDRGVARRPD